MRGHADYETTIAVTGGNTTTVSGSLAERNRTEVAPQATVTPVPTDAIPFLSNTSIIAAVLGSVATIIGAAATIFSIHHKHP